MARIAVLVVAALLAGGCSRPAEDAADVYGPTGTATALDASGDSTTDALDLTGMEWEVVAGRVTLQLYLAAPPEIQPHTAFGGILILYNTSGQSEHAYGFTVFGPDEAHAVFEGGHRAPSGAANASSLEGSRIDANRVHFEAPRAETLPPSDLLAVHATGVALRYDSDRNQSCTLDWVSNVPRPHVFGPPCGAA